MADDPLIYDQAKRRARQACCPRCGYDQRGVMSQWTQECPLRATCAECGLEFAWGELLAPKKYEPKWCVEYARKSRHVPGALVATVFVSLLPWVFWNRQRLAFRLRPVRLLLYILFLLFITATSFAMEQTMTAVAARMIAGMPRTWGMAVTVNHSYADAIKEAVLHPLAKKSTGTIKLSPFYSDEYPPPRKIHQWTAYRAGRWNQSPNIDTVWPVSRFCVQIATYCAVLFPVLFIALPISRRQCRVRWVHVARAAAYSLVWPAFVVSASLLLLGVALLVGNLYTPLMLLITLMILALPAFIILWWALAIRQYFQMPHVVVIIATFTVIVALARAVVWAYSLIWFSI